MIDPPAGVTTQVEPPVSNHLQEDTDWTLLSELEPYRHDEMTRVDRSQLCNAGGSLEKVIKSRETRLFRLSFYD